MNCAFNCFFLYRTNYASLQLCNFCCSVQILAIVAKVMMTENISFGGTSDASGKTLKHKSFLTMLSESEMKPWDGGRGWFIVLASFFMQFIGRYQRKFMVKNKN